VAVYPSVAAVQVAQNHCEQALCRPDAAEVPWYSRRGSGELFVPAPVPLAGALRGHLQARRQRPVEAYESSEKPTLRTTSRRLFYSLKDLLQVCRGGDIGIVRYIKVVSPVQVYYVTRSHVSHDIPVLID